MAPLLEHGESVRERGGLLPGRADFALPRGRDLEVASRAAAALRSRAADPRSEQTALLEPVERRVDRARRDGSPSTFQDLRANSRSVTVPAEPEERQQQHLF